eukprot:gene2743-2996_t
MWNEVTIFVAEKLNALTSWISPPPNVERTSRKVLVVQCHPAQTSFNALAAESVCKGLLKAGHNVRLRRLYCYDDNSVSFALPAASQERFSVSSYASSQGAHLEASLTSKEQKNYDNGVEVPADVREAVQDLLWCDSLVFVYPTWWFNFPAALKGYFDRVLLPGVAYTSPDQKTPAPFIGGTGLIPKLLHVNKVGVVTTFGASRLVVVFAGDNGRRFISRGFRALMAPGSQMMWHGLYESTVCGDDQRQTFLQTLEEDYSHF